MDIDVDAFLWTYALTSLRNIGVKFMGHVVEKCQMVLESDCTLFHFYQKYVTVPSALYPCPHLVLSFKI